MTKNIDQIVAENPRLSNGIELMMSIIRRVFISVLEDCGVDPSDPETQARYAEHAKLLNIAAFATVTGTDAETVEQVGAKISDGSSISAIIANLMPEYMDGARMATDLIGSSLNSQARDYLKQTAEAYKEFMQAHPSTWEAVQINDAAAQGTLAGMDL